MRFSNFCFHRLRWEFHVSQLTMIYFIKCDDFNNKQTTIAFKEPLFNGLGGIGQSKPTKVITWFFQPKRPNVLPSFPNSKSISLLASVIAPWYD